MSGELPEWLPVAITLLSLAVGVVWLLGKGRPGAGFHARGPPGKAVSRLLQEHESSTAAGEEPDSHGCRTQPSYRDSAPAMLVKSTPASSAPVALRYTLAATRTLPLGSASGGAEIWEVLSVDDASALLSGCPKDSLICSSFSLVHAEGAAAQASALQELAGAEPAGLVFATVDIGLSPEVAAWAGVSVPLVRILRPDGSIIDDVPATDVGKGVLHQRVLSLAATLAKEAVCKLEKLAERFPGALCDQLTHPPLKADIERMRRHGQETLKAAAASDADHEVFSALCTSSRPGGARVARVREVVALARLVRGLPAGRALPLLDLARRLAAQKTLGLGEPGGHEAVELLLDAVCCHGFDGESLNLACASLALHFVSGCFLHHDLQEALLPVVAKLVSSTNATWAGIWDLSGASFPGGSAAARAREAGAAVLLNASVALRTARFRAQHAQILAAALEALHREAGDERLSLAVGNLLAVGGGRDDAKRALQAQPLAPLRALAAAVFRGDLDGPDGCAFPMAWRPEPPPRSGEEGRPAAPGAAHRRPPRGAIPARHRRQRGGG